MSYAHMHGELRRDHHINPRSEANQPESLSRPQHISHCCPAHNTTREDPGDLLDDYLGLPRLQGHDILFVRCRSIWPESRQKSSRLIANIHNCPRHRNSVNVDIEYRQEDAHEGPRRPFRLIRLWADGHDLAIGRCQQQFCTRRNSTLWISEEISDEGGAGKKEQTSDGHE